MTEQEYIQHYKDCICEVDLNGKKETGFIYQLKNNYAVVILEEGKYDREKYKEVNAPFDKVTIIRDKSINGYDLTIADYIRFAKKNGWIEVA